MKAKEQPRNAFGQFVKAGDGPAGAPKKAAARRKAKGRARTGTIKWTKEKEAIFFRELAMVCNVTSALRAAKLLGSSSMAYERRKVDPRFAAEWWEAIDQSYAMLELEVLERTRFGKDRPPPQTEAERRLRAIPTALALQLLRLHQNRVRSRPAGPAAANRGAPRLTPERGDALRRQIEQMLSDFNRRMGGKG